MSVRDSIAIAGLGMTEMGKVYGRTATGFAADAIALALADAGLTKGDLDGLLIHGNVNPEMNPNLQLALGFENLRVLSTMNGYGSTPSAMLQYAASAIADGQADVIAMVYADAPLQPTRGAGDSYATKLSLVGLEGLPNAYGFYGANPGYAMAARRHMHLYGTTSEQFGAVAVAQRQWAHMNPQAQMQGKALTLDDHQSSRWIAEPLHLFDCCLVSNGAIAFIVTSPERARDLAQPPVYVHGVGQAAPGDSQRSDRHPGVVTGATASGKMAFAQAGVGIGDIDVLELYDCYTYTVLVTLEDYGFCAKGEGGAFVEDGKLAPGGSLPCNTGGGQLSSFYMWGFTPLSEGVIQARGQGGERQVTDHDLVLVSGNGGYLNYHSTMILSPHEAK